MEAAIGSLFFLLASAGICALIYRHRDALNEWLNSAEKQKPSDAKLLELKGNVKSAKSELRKYQKRLQLQQDITDAEEKLEEMNKAETGK